MTERTIDEQAQGDQIVGHKTFSTGDPWQPFRHEPLTRGEADEMLERIERADKERAERMPDQHAALSVMFEAYLRLKELGWRDACYCPKDGTLFDVIEAGSTGIHECHYQGDWPGTYWIHSDNDLWPARPILFRARALPPNDQSDNRNN